MVAANRSSGGSPPATSIAPLRSSPPSELSARGRLAAPHNDRSEQFEVRRFRRQGLQERKIALAINRGDRVAQEARDRLESRIETEVTTRVQEGLKVASLASAEAGRYFLAAP